MSAKMVSFSASAVEIRVSGVKKEKTWHDCGCCVQFAELVVTREAKPLCRFLELLA